jgi:hypothetical protein
MASPQNPLAANLPPSKRYYSAKEEEELIFSIAQPVESKNRDQPFDTRYGQYFRKQLSGSENDAVGASIKRSVELSAEHMGHLNDLDLMASSILALVYSSSNITKTLTQTNSNLKTVAVALHLKTLYVAHNGLDLGNLASDHHERTVQKDDRDFLKKKESEYYKTNLTVTSSKAGISMTFCPEKSIADFFSTDDVFKAMVSNVRLLDLKLNANKHAEVGLLEFFMGTINSVPDAIGVSKPCCQACGRILMAFGVNITCVHNINPTLLSHYTLPVIPEGKEKTDAWKATLERLKSTGE